MSRVYMIRHGKPAATWGAQLAEIDPGLDVDGRNQAKKAADALMALAPEHRPTAVVSSPLRRCKETARPFAEMLGIELVVEPAVAEVPTPHGMADSERGAWLRRAFATDWSKIEGEIDYRLWRDRVAEAVARNAGAAVFTHFVALNAAVAVATGSDKVMNFQPDHASITTFEVENGVLKLVSLGREAVTAIL
jgi:broad specificity phosphatase PhoE